MKARGFSLIAIIFWRLPGAFCLRAWRVIARPCNKYWINRLLNQPRFVAFANELAKSERPRMFVIVMPFTLHYLLPCVKLLQDHSQVILLFNGARRWERQLLRKRFPELQKFTLWTLPLTSIDHGAVINLLLTNHKENFGLVDHDCYVFDEKLFSQLSPSSDEVLLAYFHEQSRNVDLTFPLTYFMYFNAEALRRLMQDYKIDASLYRKPPNSALNALTRLGLEPNKFLKHYHSFFDTLHILLCVALSEDYRVRYLSSENNLAMMHVGSTSVGIHHTKGLYELYIHLRFLELLDDPELKRRYAFLTYPLKSSSEALARRNPYDPAWQQQPVANTLIRHLREKLTNSVER